MSKTSIDLIGYVFHTQSEAQLRAAGLLVAGQPENSQIYFRLNGSTGTNGPKTMPSGGALSAADLDVIKNWITAIAP